MPYIACRASATFPARDRARNPSMVLLPFPRAQESAIPYSLFIGRGWTGIWGGTGMPASALLRSGPCTVYRIRVTVGLSPLTLKVSVRKRPGPTRPCVQ